MDLRLKSKWTYPEIDALRKHVNMDWEEFAKAVGLSVKYLTVYLKRNYEDPSKYQPPGREVTNRMNAFVETLKTSPLKTTPTFTKDQIVITPYPVVAERDQRMSDFMENLVEHVYALIRASPPNDTVTFTVGVQYSGKFLVRRTFTRCPKCRHVDEMTFDFKTTKEANEAYEKARQWLERETERTPLVGYS